MLTLTENAATAVKAVVAGTPDVEASGIRIRGAETPTAGFELTLAPSPEPADAVVESDGARVFLDAMAQSALDDQVLDARMNEDGSVRFALAAQT
jgi:Fe-S cluster assembly iron-binding protein IscA